MKEKIRIRDLERYTALILSLTWLLDWMHTHIIRVSFHIGFRVALILLVFCLNLAPSSGISLTLTYGSANPLGSIGMRFLASMTVEYNKMNKHQSCIRHNFHKSKTFFYHFLIYHIYSFSPQGLQLSDWLFSVLPLLQP